MTKQVLKWGWVLALALLVTACGQLPQDPLLRDLERKSGLIVYIGPDRNIYTIDQGGSNQTAVTTDAGTDGGIVHDYRFPTWAPDAGRLAFAKISITSAGLFDAAQVYTAEPDGSGLVESFTSDKQYPIYLYWSPDSQRLSFLTSAASGSLILQMVPAQGGEPQVLDAGNPYYWSWAPDSQNMLVHVGGASRTQPRARLALLNLSQGVIEEGIELRPTEFQAPAWSPDGQRLLVAIETDQGDNALLLTDQRGADRKILKLFEGSIAFGWSPDGKRVAYTVSEGSRLGTLGSLAVIDPDEPTQARSAEGKDVIAFFWSPDSQKVAYFELVLFEPTPEPGQADPPSSEPIWLLKLSVLDVAGGKSHEVTTFQPSREFVGVVPYYDQYQRSATIWSPDSKNLVLSGYPIQGDPPALGLWVVAASGNLAPRFLTEGRLAFWSWK